MALLQLLLSRRDVEHSGKHLRDSLVRGLAVRNFTDNGDTVPSSADDVGAIGDVDAANADERGSVRIPKSSKSGRDKLGTFDFRLLGMSLRGKHGANLHVVDAGGSGSQHRIDAVGSTADDGVLTAEDGSRSRHKRGEIHIGLEHSLAKVQAVRPSCNGVF